MKMDRKWKLLRKVVHDCEINALCYFLLASACKNFGIFLVGDEIGENSFI